MEASSVSVKLASSLGLGLLIVFFLGRSPAGAQTTPEDVGDSPPVVIDIPDPVLTGIETDLDLSIAPGRQVPSGLLELSVSGSAYPVEFEDGRATVNDVTFGGGSPEVVLLQDGQAVLYLAEVGGEPTTGATTSSIPGWLALVPPLLAIGLALATKAVIPSLLLGIWSAAWFTRDLSIEGMWLGLTDVIDKWLIEAVVPPDGSTGHVSIIVFTMLIGGMVGIISRNGGTDGIVERISGWATNRRRGTTATAAVGTGIFFDDYATMLVTGNSMRPVTDRLGVSRSKLSYLVDTSAAPLAMVALVTTWVGFQVGLIADATAQLEGYTAGGYATFLQSIPYLFYPVLALIFMWVVASTGRDFGRMLEAERQAGERSHDGTDDENELAPDDETPRRAFNALVPITVLIGVTIAGLFITGSGSSLTDIIGSADSYASLLWGSLLAVLVAASLSIGQRLLTLDETVAAWFTGVKAIVEVLVILAMAWALSALTQALFTANYLASLLGESIPRGLLPALFFVLAAATAFATGTSWGTMGILLPLAVPLAAAIAGGDLGGGPLLYGSIGAVLGGAVWGDHASPISDTTVLSAATAGDDVVDHANTQMPYALVVGAVSLLLGYLPIGFGIPWWIALPVAAAVVVGIVFVIGETVEDEIGSGRATSSSAGSGSSGVRSEPATAAAGSGTDK